MRLHYNVTNLELFGKCRCRYLCNLTLYVTESS